MQITIADVAAKAGVSKTTVSRVLNGKGELDASTAERVRRVIAELGYVPSARAVGLARGRTGVIGMLIPSLTWPWIGYVLQGAVDVVESESRGLMVFTCANGDESMRKFANQVSAKAFDALLVIEPEGQLDYIAELHSQGMPVVLIDDRESRPQFPSVAATNRLGGESAARHLLSAGRTRPAMITGEMRFGCAVERMGGFIEVYAEAGHPIPESRIMPGDFSFPTGGEAVRALLDSGAEFDAIFAHNDLMAAGAVHALRAAGLRIPEDVHVVGFDDVPLADYNDPPLTSVRQPGYEIGATAARLLIAHLGGQPLPDTTVIPTELIIRQSSPAPAPAPAAVPVPAPAAAPEPQAVPD